MWGIKIGSAVKKLLKSTDEEKLFKYSNERNNFFKNFFYWDASGEGILSERNGLNQAFFKVMI